MSALECVRKELMQMKPGEIAEIDSFYAETMLPATGSDNLTRLALAMNGNRDDAPRSTTDRMRELAEECGCRMTTVPWRNNNYLFKKV